MTSLIACDCVLVVVNGVPGARASKTKIQKYFSI